MNAVDTSEQFDRPSQQEQSPSLLTIILDTNPAAWSLLSGTLPFSSAVANLLVFINAHLAANYANKIAVIASHCDKAQWLYPSPTEQKLPRSHQRQTQYESASSESTQRLGLNVRLPSSSSTASSDGNKYRPFRIVEEEVLRNLTALLSTTTPESVSSSTSTMIAGALTLALSNVNRESIAYAESLIGTTSATADPTSSNAISSTGEGNSTNSLQSRILLVSASPSTDLAHQYIPIMNAIFACQRLSIPIDILQLPLPIPPSTQQPQPSVTDGSGGSTSPSSNSTLFLQQAADATHGIFIPADLPDSKSGASASQAFLTYLLLSFLPSPNTRSRHLILPTRIDVDFRAACFCHRNIVSIGFVCSICLSIFCSVPENGDCLTCGTHLTVGKYGSRPVVVPKKSKKKQGATAVR
ncbi:transcription initiation factor TFIIH subunit H3 [Exophiala viscosa]|uniref:General transcription and DNA repair factor IIH subunit TFB4 n=1 Tax=Exophiala viscosa TaxID=2486360 RepID=A0AAN6DSY7_9EURO|nr:transcription initiation factor TFIIH subunit H3 [Exophiala viscosa]KAI1624641.1 transcription initiation factor TFIIH subunit H3 [Exophiala viscosa]